jgi:hypothetical protein
LKKREIGKKRKKRGEAKRKRIRREEMKGKS